MNVNAKKKAVNVKGLIFNLSVSNKNCKTKTFKIANSFVYFFGTKTLEYCATSQGGHPNKLITPVKGLSLIAPEKFYLKTGFYLNKRRRNQNERDTRNEAVL